MPKRLGFHVIFATSEEPGYPACELNVQAPSARGWRSGADSSVPHELLLRLHARATVHKLQLLAHHHLIPSSIEVLVYDPGEDGTTAQTPCGAAYTSVGHVALAPPSTTNDTRLRELRSAALPEPTSAKFIKLRLSAPHDATDNTQQVALMGVNILGTEVLEVETSKVDNEAKYSPYDDLAFTMYVDSEIADIIRRLDEKKQVAIAEERFEYASKLKACCSALGAAGLRLGRWRLRKRLAAAADAFERARALRDRLVCAVATIRGDPLLTRLLEEDGVNLKNDESHPEVIDFTPHLSQPTSNLSFDIPSPPTASASRKSIPINTADLNSAENEEQYIQITAEMNFYKDDQNDSPQNDNFKPRRIVEESVKRKIDVEVQRPYNESLKLKLSSDDRPCYNEARSQLSNVIANGKSGEMGKTGIVTKVTGVDYGCDRQIRPDQSLMEGDGDSPARSISPTSANRNGEIVRSGSSPGGVRGAGGVVVRRRNKSAGPGGAPNRSSYEAYEERPIPALRHSHTNEYLRECQHIEPEPRVTPRMSERDRKQAALPILIFGQQLVDKFYSKHYADKEEGLHRLRDSLREWTQPETVPRNTSPNKTARAAVALLHRALKDKVSSVYSLATELVRFFFQDFVAGRVCASEVGRSVEKLLPELLAKSGDPVPRIHSTAQHTILTMAECPAVRSLHIIPQQLVRPMSAATAPRLALSKFQMLEQLLLTHGFSTDKNSGLTVRRVAEAGAAGAAHAAAAVRAVAERVLLAAYARCPRLVRAQLPPDDAVSRRNLLYRHLFQQFDKIDTQKLLGQTPTHEQFLNGTNQQHAPDINGGGDFVDLSNIGFKESTHASSLMGESIGSSLTTTSQNSSTLSRTSTNTKSSLKKTPSKKFNIMKDTSNYPGYNKLRLDSAVSPKHSPRLNKTVQETLTSERVHFNETVTSQSHTNTVVYRNVNRNTDNRHSMIDFEHQKEFKPELKERPMSVCDPGQLASTISRGVSDSKHSLYRESYSSSPSDLTSKISVLSVGVKSMKLDDSRQMEESGYYSPVETSCKRGSRKNGPVTGEYCDGLDGDMRSVGSSHSGGTTPDGNYRENMSMCAWCLAAVVGEQMDAHYWRQCHLLARCPACRLVLEARVLHRHLAEECGDRHRFGVCQRCEATLQLDELHRHSADNVACQRATEDEWKCPHCLSNIPASEDSWRIHLTSQCGSNPRIQ